MSASNGTNGAISERDRLFLDSMDDDELPEGVVPIWRSGRADSPRVTAPSESPRELAQRKRYTLLDDVEIEQMPDPLPLIAGHVFQHTLVSVVAPYASYKTFLLLSWALSIATGTPWFGHGVVQGPVVYVVAEGVAGIKRRVLAWKLAHHFTGRAGVYFLPVAVPLTDRVAVRELVAAIRALPQPPVAIFVDTLSRNFGGKDQKDGADMALFIDACDELRETFHATVFVAHHTGWEGTRSRGASDWPGAVDTEITLQRSDAQPGVVTAKCTKQKDASEFPPITLQALPVNGSDSLVLVQADEPALSAPAGPIKGPTNPEHCLFVLWSTFGPDGATHGDWFKAAGLAKSSFNKALSALLRDVYVKQRDGNRYVVTDAGRLKLGPLPGGPPVDQQWTRSTGPLVHTPIGVDQVDHMDQAGGEVGA